MMTNTANTLSLGASPMWRRARWLLWGGAAVLLLVPLVAMRFTDEVNWTPADFLVMGAMLGLACAACEVAVRVANSDAYVLGAGIAVATAFLMTWSNLAVGVVGEPAHPANLMFHGVVLVGLLATALARFQPRGMARAMAITALAQALAAGVAFFLADDVGRFAGGLFVPMWLASAWLFGKAARQPGELRR